MTLSPKQAAKFIDHTLLKAEITDSQIQSFCQEARRFDVFSVCVPGSWIARCRNLLEGSDVKTITVIGFPLGHSHTKAKVYETQAAIDLGAHEVDAVVNVGWILENNWINLEKELSQIAKACLNTPLKVILETCYLSETQIKQACRICVDVGAKFVKTSTGFGPGGATQEQIKWMRESVGPDVGVKASGGIRTLESFTKMLAAGANRIGTSSTQTILTELAGKPILKSDPSNTSGGY